MLKGALARIRHVMQTLPDVDERVSHGAPWWFTSSKKSARSFAAFADNHHNDGRVALWCAAEAGAQSMLVDADPARFFVPPYVGTAGWVGVLVPRVDDAELARIIHAAHATVAARLAAKNRAPVPAPKRAPVPATKRAKAPAKAGSVSRSGARR